MVLVDTSVWINHLKMGNAELEVLLNNGEVVCHQFIIGEIACGHVKNRTEILALLGLLPAAVKAKHEEVMELIEFNKLMGIGLGYIDIHLLASARLTGVSMWTFDKNLDAALKRLNIRFDYRK